MRDTLPVNRPFRPRHRPRRRNRHMLQNRSITRTTARTIDGALEIAHDDYYEQAECGNGTLSHVISSEAPTRRGFNPIPAPRLAENVLNGGGHKFGNRNPI